MKFGKINGKKMFLLGNAFISSFERRSPDICSFSLLKANLIQSMRIALASGSRACAVRHASIHWVKQHILSVVFACSLSQLAISSLPGFDPAALHGMLPAPPCAGRYVGGDGGFSWLKKWRIITCYSPISAANYKE